MLENNALWLLLRSQFYLSGSVIFKIPHTYGMDASGVFLRRHVDGDSRSLLPLFRYFILLQHTIHTDLFHVSPLLYL